MATIDLIHCIPENVASEASYDDLWDTVQGVDRWGERQAQVLDYIYQTRLIHLLRSRDDISELEPKLLEFAVNLDRVTHPERSKELNSLAKPYGARWCAYQEIAESRLESLRSPASEMFLKRSHVEEILKLVLTGEAKNQRDVESALGIKPPNVTRILKIMEECELIERHSVGREKHLVVGMHGERFREVLLDKGHGAYTSEGSACRGSTYLVALGM